MPFSAVRNDMRQNQNLLYNSKDGLNETQCQPSDIINRKKTHKVSLIKQNHLNKVASTASPLLPKTPNRVIIMK